MSMLKGRPNYEEHGKHHDEQGFGWGPIPEKPVGGCATSHRVIEVCTARITRLTGKDRAATSFLGSA